jgi:pimeloyl-ACP methyl ester carboxylesterase
MAISEELGTERSVELPAGTIRYRERGDGPPVVFVHGVLVNADLWRKVVPAVAEGHRCIAPDWPLGSHEVPMRPDADLSPPGLARLIADFLEALDLDDVTIVANDTGGALTQILMSKWPDRIGRVVLTPSDCFEYFFPPGFNFMPKLLRVPGQTWVLSRIMQIKALHPLPMVFGMLARRPIPVEVRESWVRPSRRSAGVRRDLRSVITQVHRRYTLAAAQALSTFQKPVLLAWAAEDKVFPLRFGERLATVLPDARLITVADSYTFVPEDQPGILSGLITDFIEARSRRTG